MFDNDNIYINSLNEDYFDDIEITDKDIESNNEIFTEPNEVGITNKYTFNIEFTGIPIDVRRSGFNAYVSMLKQINDKFNRLMPYLEYIATTDKLVFCLNDWAWNKNQYYAMRVIGDVAKPEMNDINGVIIYNDSRFFDKTDEIINLKRFNIKWGVNYIDINENRFPNVIIDLYKCMMRVCKSIYPTLSVWSITMIGTDDNIQRKVCLNKKTIYDLTNKTNNNGTHNGLKKLYRVIYGKTIPRQFYKEFFNKAKLSQMSLQVLNALQVTDINAVYVDEDSSALRVTIPKDYNLKLDIGVQRKIMSLHYKYNKYIKVFIEGKLYVNLNTWWMVNQEKVNNFLDMFGYNIEELVLKVGWTEEQITVDLSMFNINNLKVVYMPCDEYSKRRGYKQMKVVLNKQFKPKKYKVIDNSNVVKN